MVLRPSLKRVVPGSVPPWRAPCFAWPRCGFGLPGVDFRAPAVVFHVRVKTCALAAAQRRFSSGAKPSRPRLRCFLTNFLCETSASWFVFLEGQDPWLRAKKLLLLVRRSPLNAVCQLLCRSPLAVAPVLRNFAAGGRSFSCARFVELRRPSGSWRLEAGPGWVGLRSKLLMSFALKNLRLEIFEP